MIQQLAQAFRKLAFIFILLVIINSITRGIIAEHMNLMLFLAAILFFSIFYLLSKPKT